EPVALEHLDVIGYADVLPDGKGPAVVPPVFQVRTELDRCYVPPFRIAGNWLIDAKCISSTEVENLHKNEDITLPKGLKRPAGSEHQLWVDENGVLHYDPAANAKRELQRIYHEHLENGIVALKEGKIE